MTKWNGIAVISDHDCIFSEKQAGFPKSDTGPI